jgi:hypothetical protein
VLVIPLLPFTASAGYTGRDGHEVQAATRREPGHATHQARHHTAVLGRGLPVLERLGPRGVLHLYPNAFRNEEELVKTNGLP